MEDIKKFNEIQLNELAIKHKTELLDSTNKLND